MRKTILWCGALALGISSVAAETPSLTGVWKANIDASKFVGGPKPTAYLMIVQQQGATVRLTSGTTNMMGEYRASFTFGTGTQESRNYWRGIPMVSKAQWAEGALVVDSRILGTHPQTMHDKYSLAADGKTLTIETTSTRDGKDMQQTIVLDKQPDEAGEPLRQPEATATQRFKNVKVLGEMPASRFLDAMSNFSMSLGSHCEFCHVEHDFASDDKKEKSVARDMIQMTHSISEHNFSGRNEVVCFTCHRGAEKPLQHPE